MTVIIELDVFWELRSHLALMDTFSTESRIEKRNKYYD